MYPFRVPHALCPPHGICSPLLKRCRGGTEFKSSRTSCFFIPDIFLESVFFLIIFLKAFELISYVFSTPVRTEMGDECVIESPVAASFLTY